MEASSSTICFTCGLATDDTGAINRLPDGSACPSCRDRLLEILPAALPARPFYDRMDDPEVDDGEPAGEEAEPGDEGEWGTFEGPPTEFPEPEGA